MKLKTSIFAALGVTSLMAMAAVACGDGQPTSLKSKTVGAAPIASTTTVIPASNQSSPTVAQASGSEPARTVEFCVVRMARVNDPNPPLNVRSTPSTASNNIVGQLKNGTLVSVVDEQNDWFQITTPMKGWVAKSRTESGCNQKTERVSFRAGETSVSIRDRFIGTGSHAYKLRANKGQTITVTRLRGPLPIILAPDGSTVINDPAIDTLPSWTGQLPETGDYTLQMESNFRGYNYSFSVQIQ